MGIFEHFPYTNFHELNLDWVIDFIQSGKLDIESSIKLVEELVKNQPDEIKKAVNDELQGMVARGEFNEISEKYITPQVNGLVKSGIDLHKILFIGDSFLGDWFNGYSNFAVYFADKLGLVRDVDYKIYSFGGAGYIAGDINTHQNYEQLFTNTIVPDLGDTISSYSAVIVFSGPNDYEQTYEKEYGAITSFLTAVKNKMPDASIIGLNGATLDQKFNTTQFASNDAYADFGATTFPKAAYWMIGRTDLFLDDHLHPNERGMKYIAGMLLNAIKSGDDSSHHIHFFANGDDKLVITVHDSVAEIYALTNITEAKASHTICTLPTWFKPNVNTWIGTGFSYTSAKHGNAIIWSSSGNLDFWQDTPEAIGAISVHGTMYLGR